jgi:glycosyltransferase involved in cell wall biosynthesis
MMVKIQSKRPLLTVVVPIFNEELNLPDVLPPLISYCCSRNWKVLLVNDGSTDGTWNILDSYRNRPGVRVFQHKVNRGYGGALKTGILQTDTPYLITIDGDGQHDPADIEKIFTLALERDADLVVGTRGPQLHTDWYRELGKWIIRGFARLLISFHGHDLNSGFKLYRSELAKRYIYLCPDSMAFSDVITLVFISQRNLVLEYPITVKQRKSGESTITTFTAVETVMELINLMMLFNPLRIFLPISGCFILIGLGWGIPFLIRGSGVSVGSMLAIVIGLLFFAIGLIASQLSAIRMGMFNQKGEYNEDSQNDLAKD